MVPIVNTGSGNDQAGRPCGGRDVSPQLAWSGAPKETQSYALSMVDIDGRRGAGVTHWLLYNIPATVASVPAGAGTPELYSGGKNVYDRIGYAGPCTTSGEAPHHYVITLYALDTPPGLPAGLDRDGFLKALQPHALRVTSLIGRSVRAAAAPVGMWTTKAQLPTAHSEVGAAAVNGKIYLLGGTIDVGSMAMLFNEEYDPATDRARERAPLPQTLSHIGVVGLNGKVYAVGGFSDVQADHTGAVSSLLVYDPAANTWRALAPMKEPRGSVGAVAVNGKIYAIGGRGLDLKTVATNEVYDPATNKWTEIAPLPKARDHVGAVAVGGKIHIIGGRFGASRDFTGLHDVYDPATNTWTSAAPLPTPRSSVAAALYHGMIVVDGGECNNGAIFNENEGYDVKSDRWVTLATMPIGLHGFGAAVVGPTLYFLGGANQCGGGPTKVSANIFAFNLP